MTNKTWKRYLLVLVCGAIPLLAIVGCSSFGGGFGYYDDYYYDDYHGDYYYDGYGYDDVIIIDEYDDCFFFDCH